MSELPRYVDETGRVWRLSVQPPPLGPSPSNVEPGDLVFESMGERRVVRG